MQKHVGRVLQLIYPSDYMTSARKAIKVQLDQEEKGIGKRFRFHRRYYLSKFLRSTDIDPEYMFKCGILHENSHNQYLDCLYDSIESFIAQTYRSRLEGVINIEQVMSSIIYAMNNMTYPDLSKLHGYANNMTYTDLSKLYGYAFSRHPFGDIRIEDKGNYYAYAHTHFVVHPSRPTFHSKSC